MYRPDDAAQVEAVQGCVNDMVRRAVEMEGTVSVCSLTSVPNPPAHYVALGRTRYRLGQKALPHAGTRAGDNYCDADPETQLGP